MMNAQFQVNKIIEQNKKSRHPFKISTSKQYKLGLESSEALPIFGWQYFYEDLWGGRKVAENKPAEHWDVGSTVFGFISHLLCFRKDINLIDIRPLKSDISGITFICADATEMSNIADNSIESLSALCSLEHFGLGRYGDMIDPEGWRKAMKSFQRVLKPGGHLYLSVPIACENRVCFNAHRMFTIDTIIESVPNLKLVELSISINFALDKVIWENEFNQLEKNQELFELISTGKIDGNFGMFEFTK